MNNKYWLLIILGLFFIIRRRTILTNHRWPHSGPITSPFGMRTHPITGEYKMHKGIDIDGETGDQVKASMAGVIDTSGVYGSAGNLIKIKHANGDLTSYMHLNERYVNVGDHVNTGDVIGTMGATGAVTGSHLHYSIETPAGYIDPLSVLV